MSWLAVLWAWALSREPRHSPKPPVQVSAPKGNVGHGIYDNSFLGNTNTYVYGSSLRNTTIYDVTIVVNEGWMTRDAARVVPELIRQAVAELKTQLMLIAAENAVTMSATIIQDSVERPFDLSGPEEDVR